MYLLHNAIDVLLHYYILCNIRCNSFIVYFVMTFVHCIIALMTRSRKLSYTAVNSFENPDKFYGVREFRYILHSVRSNYL